MDLYTDTAYRSSELLTKRYSTSFSSSAALFPKAMRKHIYAIYGLVRIADEIVDTYKGELAGKELSAFKIETYSALQKQYSTNPIVHAFAVTAKSYNITKDLIEPFFESMASDLVPHVMTEKSYKTYIYGSAEVVGLMCLRVFCHNNDVLYEKLEEGAMALGAGYQKVNFLRDLASDYNELGRIYFPSYTFESFNETAKNIVVKDIENDFKKAKQAIAQLPKSSKTAVAISYQYYNALLKKLSNTSVEMIKSQRVRIPTLHKAAIISKTFLKESRK